MRELIEKLSRELGWTVAEVPFCGITVEKGVGLVPTTKQGKICLAAYAKAEMAKRGWLINMDPVNHKMYVWPLEGGEVTRAVPPQGEPVDITSPLSEAHAILRACAEALSL